MPVQLMLRDVEPYRVMEQLAIAIPVSDARGTLVHANGPARELFGLSSVHNSPVAFSGCLARKMGDLVPWWTR